MFETVDILQVLPTGLIQQTHFQLFCVFVNRFQYLKITLYQAVEQGVAQIVTAALTQLCLPLPQALAYWFKTARRPLLKRQQPVFAQRQTDLFRAHAHTVAIVIKQSRLQKQVIRITVQFRPLFGIQNIIQHQRMQMKTLGHGL